jgi:hypothetical protein
LISKSIAVPFPKRRLQPPHLISFLILVVKVCWHYIQPFQSDQTNGAAVYLQAGAILSCGRDAVCYHYISGDARTSPPVPHFLCRKILFFPFRFSKSICFTTMASRSK